MSSTKNKSSPLSPASSFICTSLFDDVAASFFSCFFREEARLSAPFGALRSRFAFSTLTRSTKPSPDPRAVAGAGDTLPLIQLPGRLTPKSARMGFCQFPERLCSSNRAGAFRADITGIAPAYCARTVNYITFEIVQLLQTTLENPHAVFTSLAKKVQQLNLTTRLRIRCRQSTFPHLSFI